MCSPTQRFSNRVDNYLRHRPSYPAEAISLLQRECGLNPECVVADIGSGTGKLTELMLPHAKAVFAVEPNREMREAAERLLGSQPNFTSVNGTAEATTLPDKSIDLIVVGQAFHWFEPEETRTEFKRILKPQGFVALIWNDRLTDTTPFLNSYETLLRGLGTDYEKVNHRNVDAPKMKAFFGNQPELRTFPYSQPFDYEGLKGRLLSSSYAPAEGEPGGSEMLNQLRRIFEAHQQNGRVSFDYSTLVYHAQL